MMKMEAVRLFLNGKAHTDLAALFNPEMELQVNVGQDGGEKITGNYLGHNWSGWQRKEGGEIWKSFRVPWKANTESPEYEDSELKFSTDHFEAIGMTGWNWEKQESLYVGFDFDSLIGHKVGLSNDELVRIRKLVEEVPWITVRKSTSGKGLHLYVFLDPPIPTVNHTEHAALARAILGLLSARVGVQLQTKVDVCGGILWIWHRRMSPDGYALIRAGLPLSDVPVNWRDHVEVITAKAPRKAKPPVASTEQEALQELIGKTKVAQLDDQHRLLFAWLAEHQCYWWWDADRGILVAHTSDLQSAHRAMKLKGPFYTLSTGKDAGPNGRDQNCFAFPLRGGAWVVRRHTRRTPEHASWTLDSSGWTRCYLNCQANFLTAARCHGGVERADGRFEFMTFELAMSTLKDLGAVPFDVEPWLIHRPALLREHKDGRAVLSVMYVAADPMMPQGWVLTKDRQFYERIVDIQNDEPEVEVPDEFVRHLVEGGQDGGWYIFTRGLWTYEPEGNIRKAMLANGIHYKLHQNILGQCILHPWHLVNQPFQSEYPGNRTWNRQAPQLAFDPSEGEWGVWKKIFNHLGQGLDEAVQQHSWCQENQIKTGAEYLTLWVASLFQFPSEPLPYLFFYGPQNTGKTMLQEAIGILIKDRRGVVQADVALTNQQRFNGELKGAILCYIEETNLQADKNAYARIKDWVTSKSLLVHEKGKTPYEIPNKTHFIQTSNDQDAVPLLPGDTRIVYVQVGMLDSAVPREEFHARLAVEGPAMTHALLNMDIPKSPDRLRVPVITSAQKLEAEYSAENVVTSFCREHLHQCDGNALRYAEVFEAFCNWLPVSRRSFWSFNKFIQKLPGDLTKGRWGPTASYCIGNVSFHKAQPQGMPLVRKYDRLFPMNEVML